MKHVTAGLGGRMDGEVVVFQQILVAAGWIGFVVMVGVMTRHWKKR